MTSDTDASSTPGAEPSSAPGPGSAEKSGEPGRRRRHSVVLDTVVSMVGLVVVWSLLSLLISHPPLNVLPGPWEVARAFGRAAGTGLAGDIWASVEEGLLGWLIGCAAATVVGVATGRFRVVSAVLFPVIELLRPISPIVWVPLSIVWFGIGLTSKLFIVALTSFFIVVVAAHRGAVSVSGDYERVADMLGMSRIRRLVQVELTAALPDILVGWRLALAAAWGGVAISELVAANRGLGALEAIANQGYDIPGIMVGMACFALLGILTNAVYVALEVVVCPWSPARIRARANRARLGEESR